MCQLYVCAFIPSVFIFLYGCLVSAHAKSSSAGRPLPLLACISNLVVLPLLKFPSSLMLRNSHSLP